MKAIENQNASTLLAVLMTILVLAIIAANVFDSATAGNSASYQSSSWEEALNAAESGADYGMNTLNQVATGGTSAWAGWTLSSGTGGTTTYTYSSNLPPHLGDGNQKMYFTVAIDNSILSGGQTWYRIRSIGTAELPGPHRVSYEESLLDINGVKNHKTMLRGLSYGSDRTAGYCHLPQVSRTVEVIASPRAGNSFLDALATQSAITLSGGEYIDSFNSGNSSYSTNGQYVAAKRQQNGNIASNSNGSVSNLNNSQVYGNASSNGGALLNTSGVTGSIYNNFSTVFPPVSAPAWTSNVTYTTVNNPAHSATLTSGSGSAPAYYSLTTLTLSGASNLTIKNPTPGQTSYIDILVTGDLSTAGTSTIIQKPGVVMTIYVEGQASVAGGGIDNENNLAADLTIYGVTPANGQTPTFTLSSSSAFTGAIYAPGYAFTLSAAGAYAGALVAGSASLSGTAGFHYDAALAGGSSAGGVSYQMASWVEDIRW